MVEGAVETDEGVGEPRRVLAFVTDLITTSRIQGAARGTGVHVDFVRDTETLNGAARASRPGALLIDLQVHGADVESVIQSLKSDEATAEIPIVVFGPHVEGEALRDARTAGADRVLARSAFVRRLPDILREAASP